MASKMWSYLLECFYDITYTEKWILRRKDYLNSLGDILSKEKCMVLNRNFTLVEQILYEIPWYFNVYVKTNCSTKDHFHNWCAD